MRRKSTLQIYMEFSQESSLKVVRDFREKYDGIDRVLRKNPGVLDFVHRCLGKHLSTSRKGREAKYTSEQVLRALVVMFVEGESYRDVVVRIEESEFLRSFVGLGLKPMMDYSFLSKAFGCLGPENWERINESLTAYAVTEKKITGEKLRIDTTAVETNIHYPTDASLLWDSWRTLVRILRYVREEYPWICAENRFHDRKTRRRFLYITRYAKSTSGCRQRTVKRVYRELMDAVERVLEISRQAVQQLPAWEPWRAELEHFQPLVEWVIDQARRRVLDGEMLPADEKLYSIFEEHTELLKRGKARKPVEFGHMVLLGQTREKFISQYRVMLPQIPDKDLVQDALDTHKQSFKRLPKTLAADKGFYESMKELQKLEKHIATVSICKKGRRNALETAREQTEDFKEGQRFRAGIEGSISVLKRVFKLGRCLFKGFRNYASSIGCAIFCHNLVLLAQT
jgi:transposase, IS5 family